MKKVLVLLASCALFVVLAGFAFAEEKKIELTSETMLLDYTRNQVDADMRYGGKEVILSGKITSFSLTQSKEPIIYLNDYRNYNLEFKSVACIFSKADNKEIASLRVGRMRKIQGVVDGPSGNVVLVRKCKIIK